MSEGAKSRRITPLFRKARSDNAKINPNYGMRGKHHSEETRLKISLHSASKNKRDEKSASWKGDKVGYHGLHKWVPKHLGKPGTCEHCGRNNLKGRQIHWANKSRKYKRNINDWLRLCSSCHTKYDKNVKTQYAFA